MRYASLASVLLIATVSLSAYACVTGSGAGVSNCPGAMRLHAGKAYGVLASTIPGCNHVARSLPGKCGMRSFLQLQFVALRALVITVPFRSVKSDLRSMDAFIMVSSAGSPETDRGPPAF